MKWYEPNHYSFKTYGKSYITLRRRWYFKCMGSEILKQNIKPIVFSVGGVFVLHSHAINIYPWVWRCWTCRIWETRKVLNVTSPWYGSDITAVVPVPVICSQRQLATSTAELMLLTTWLDCGKRVIRNISNAGPRSSYGPHHGVELLNHGRSVC